MHVSSFIVFIGCLILHKLSWVNSAELLLDCPFDTNGDPAYVKEGTVEPCTCESHEPGNPTGRVKWIDPRGKVVAEGDGNVKIDLAYNPDWLTCDYDWTVYPKAETCLKVFWNVRTWFEARDDCQKLGGDLVVIPDAEFMQFLLDYILITNRRNNNMWIGLEDLDGDGVFRWIDNKTELTYTHWKRGVPDNRGGNERCGEIFKYVRYLWNDRLCTHARLYICQKRAEHSGNHNQTYTCEGVSKVGGKMVKTYTTQFATGPHTVKANVSDVEYDILKDDRPVYVQCEVDKYKTYPKPNVTLQGVQSDLLYPVSEEETSASWVFHFNIHPSLGDNYTAKCVAENLGVARVEDEFSFTVWGPPIVKLTGCPMEEDGATPAYVMGSSNAQCGCVMTGNGNPEGEAVWMAEGSEVSKGNPLATFTISDSDNGVVYTCMGRNKNGNKSSVTYTPIIAFGPDIVIVGPPEASGDNLTFDSRSQGLELYCEINGDSFSPDISIHLEMTQGGTLHPVLPFDILSNNTRRYNFWYVPTSGGTVTAQCVASNSKFPDIKAISALTVTIFRLPEVSFLSDCPLDGDASSYIARGETKTCTCNLTTVGNPPGSVRWVNSAGEELSAGDTRAVLSLSYDSERQDNVFTCVPSSSRGQGANKTYEALFAFGPNILTFAPVAYPAVKICPGKSTSMSIVCQVPRTNAKPAPYFSILGLPSGTSISSDTDISDENLYQRKFEFDLEVSGVHSITCRATNPVTGYTAHFTRERMLAAEPPASPPSITINKGLSVVNGSILSVHPGGTVVVKCVVDGGFPPVKRVTLSCGKYVRHSHRTESRLSLVVDNIPDHTECVCGAVHISGCYKNKTYFTLHVGGRSASSQAGITTKASVGAGLGGAVILFAAVGFLLFLFCRRHRGSYNSDTTDTPDTIETPDTAGTPDNTSDTPDTKVTTENL